MTALRKTAATLLSTSYFLSSNNSNYAAVQAVMVGDTVCTTGYIMDKFCIDRGTFLDNPNEMTLKNPELHSFHCLLDVGLCKDSGYLVLTDTKDDNDMHCLGYRLSETQTVLDAGLSAGRQSSTGCTDCTGDDTKPEFGYRATVRGTIKELGDGSDGVEGTPIIENIEVLDESVECETDTVEPVCMSMGEDTTTTTTPTETSADPDQTPTDPDEAQSCPDTLEMSEVIDADATLYYAVVPANPPGSNNGLLCARLEAEHDGWVGLGFSLDNQMAGSTGVIGIPGEGISKYDLGFYVVEEMDEAKQTLMDADCFVDDDGKTIMKFTKLLVEEGEVPIQEVGANIFHHARGPTTLQHHSFQTTFEVTFGGSGELKVGDEVCITNYIMDQFCIDRGTFVDAQDTVTLEKPEDHSFHCLLDVFKCVDSGYVVLTDKNEDTGMHCLGYRLDDTQAVLDAGFAAGQEGYCTGCTGDESKPEYGFRATVKGTVKELGDGSDGPSGTPVLENIEVLDESEECEQTIVNPVCMDPPEEPEEPDNGILEVGDKVCWVGYIMDQFCINRGTFLDMPDIKTLEEPERHSFHCLLDVPDCKGSGYAVLGDKVEDTGLHCLGYRLDETQAVLDAGLAAGQKGYCQDCTGGSDKLEYGYKATVKGTVKALGDGKDGLSGAPILEDIEVLDDSVGCEKVIIPPLCPGGISTNIDAAEKPVARDCTSQLCEEQLAPDYLLRYQINVPSETTVEVCDGCTISMELEYLGDAWVSIAFSNDGLMIGAEAVIANPGDGSVLKYNLGGKALPLVTPMPDNQQTLTDFSAEFTDGKTLAKFTKKMVEPNEIVINVGDNNMIWAHGSDTTLQYHKARDSIQVNLSSGSSEAVTAPNMSAWIAHGACAFIAWGVLVPFAVQSALLRSLLPSGPLWFKLHRAFNTAAFALFVAAFAVAVSYTSKEGGVHFGNSHQKMGLAMFIMAFLQVIGGAARPHVPAPDSGEEKTSVRKGWEVGHRVLGVTLLACGFWQMQEGIKLYSVKYSVSDDSAVTIAYWVWIGVMSALIVGGVFLKLRSSSSESDNRAASAPLADEEVPVDNE